MSSYAYAGTFINPRDTLRIGEEGNKPNGQIWIEHRSLERQKLYPQVFENYFAKKGFKYSFKAKAFAGILKNAYVELKK